MHVGKRKIVVGDIANQILNTSLEQAEMGTGEEIYTYDTKAKVWYDRGIAEHASVASFSRWTLQLMAINAPPSLLREALSAGIDEVRHAELCFAAADEYVKQSQSGNSNILRPSAFPEHSLEITADIVSFVENTIREGCIGETKAAIDAGVELAAIVNPSSNAEALEKAALEEIVVDETRHASLAWRAVRWALKEFPGTISAAKMQPLLQRSTLDINLVNVLLTGIDEKQCNAIMDNQVEYNLCKQVLSASSQ